MIEPQLKKKKKKNSAKLCAFKFQTSAFFPQQPFYQTDEWQKLDL